MILNCYFQTGKVKKKENNSEIFTDSKETLYGYIFNRTFIHKKGCMNWQKTVEECISIIDRHFQD